MSVPVRFQFNPTVVHGNVDGASQVLPTGSGQMLFYEIAESAYNVNGVLQGAGRTVGYIVYDFINSRWAAFFVVDGLISTHQSTTYENDIYQIQQFIATLTSPPVPLTDEAGNDVPWPASFPNVNVS